MISLDGERLAAAAGAEVVRRGGAGGPRRTLIDSRQAREGDLFVGLRGEREDGGRFAAEALRGGAWGVLVGAEHARELAGGGEDQRWVLGSDDPLASLQALARHFPDYPDEGQTQEQLADLHFRPIVPDSPPVRRIWP